MVKSRFIAVLIAACLITWMLVGQAAQDPAVTRKAVDEFLRVQVRGLPGTASYNIGPIDPNNQLMPCDSLQVSLPTGGRLWGKTSVHVRCLMEGGWSQYIPVQIRVQGDYLVAARPLAAGQVISEADWARQTGELTELPASLVVDAGQLAGRTLAAPLAAGRPFRADLLRQTPVIQQGQTVKVVSRGPGFQVANEGQALNGAAAGQVTRVRLVTGQVVSGIARSDGTVEIAY